MELEEILAGNDFTGNFQRPADPRGGLLRTGYFERPLYQNVTAQTQGQRFANLDFNGLSAKSKAKRIAGLADKVGRKLSGSWLWGKIAPEVQAQGDIVTYTYKVRNTTWQEGTLYWPQDRTVTLQVNKATGVVKVDYAAPNVAAYVAGKDMTRLYSALRGKEYAFVRPQAPAQNQPAAPAAQAGAPA